MPIAGLRMLVRRKLATRGMSLAIVLVLLAAIVILAFGAASVVYTDIQVSRNEKLSQQAVFGAESGLEAIWHDLRYAPDVSPKDGQIDLVVGVNDLDKNTVVDFYDIYRNGGNLGSAASPITISTSPQRLVTAWVETNYPTVGVATIHSTCQIFADDGSTLLARKRMNMEVSSRIGWKIQAPVNSAVRCDCCTHPTTCL